MHKILQEPRAEGSAHLPSGEFRCTELGLKSKHFIGEKEVLPHSRHRHSVHQGPCLWKSPAAYLGNVSGGEDH